MIRIPDHVGFSDVNSSTAIPNAPSAELLDRYFAGSCSPEERTRIIVWASQLSGGERGLAMLQEMRVTDAARVVNIDRNWDMITARIQRKESSVVEHTGQVPSGNVTVRQSWTTWKTALIGLMGALLLAIGWNVASHRLKADLAGQTSLYATANGERATITLPDGSQIMLNVASQLEVPADFATGNRTVRLNGEALFTIEHHSGTPFIVETGASRTRVLGTRFVVRHYESDTTALISVENGRVDVGGLVVAADQEIEVGQFSANQHGGIRMRNMHRSGFEKGILTVDGVMLKDAIPDLNRWFNADIRIGDPAVATRLLSGDCTAGSVASLAELLELTFDLRVVRRGNTLTLYPRAS